ncbi:hypothetical protein EVAR_89070_1 [Eumeta japonica]|uniref:Uncharacterized protein n=1 Tax=Eumeta variegata TaxID=151549 RepID=A0A4C1XJI1_EUMVA|nr:hypothetical protein EVAR_89070_1 [Eumeta japonica]
MFADAHVDGFSAMRPKAMTAPTLVNMINDAFGRVRCIDTVPLLVFASSPLWRTYLQRMCETYRKYGKRKYASPTTKYHTVTENGREVTASAVAFRSDNESSDGPLPSMTRSPSIKALLPPSGHFLPPPQISYHHKRGQQRICDYDLMTRILFAPGSDIKKAIC